jgi:hypothetical protein
MLDLINPRMQGTAFATGVLLHILLYRRGEWDRAVPTLFLAYVLTQLSILNILVYEYSEEFTLPALLAVACLTISHTLGILGSMMIYRVFFHRLRSFPGPFWACISSFYVSRLSADLRLFGEVDALHNKYGDFIRLGALSTRTNFI